VSLASAIPPVCLGHAPTPLSHGAVSINVKARDLLDFLYETNFGLCHLELSIDNNAEFSVDVVGLTTYFARKAKEAAQNFPEASGLHVHLRLELHRPDGTGQRNKRICKTADTKLQPAPRWPKRAHPCNFVVFRCDSGCAAERKYTLPWAATLVLRPVKEWAVASFPFLWHLLEVVDNTRFV